MGSFVQDNSNGRRANTPGRWQTIVAGFYLVLMCTQYWPVEGGGTSLVKVAFMCLSPFVFILALRSGGHWKVIACVAVCLIWKFAVAGFQTTPFRMEPLAYSVAFFITYMMFYTLVNNGCFSLRQARILLEALLIAYVAVLIVQQTFSLTGGGEWPLMNLYGARVHVLKCQSLALEPSHSGRILGAVFYALLKIWEYQKGKRLSIGDLWREHRWMTAGFLYAMISMQSATAIFVLLLLLLYFFSWKYILPIIVIFVLLPNIAEFTGSHELERVLNVMDSTTTGDIEEVNEADGSAAYRVAAMLGMLKMDYSDIHTWVGYGVDTVHNIFADNPYARIEALPGVMDFGLIDYILSLVLVWSCCIIPIFSLPTLMYFCGVGGATLNGAYGWGILMIFTIVSYFYKKYHGVKAVGDDGKQA